MSFSESACEMTSTEGELGRLIRPSPMAARPALASCPPLASAVSVAVLGLASLLNIAHGASSLAEQNWPQWRGPLQNGVAPHANPPTEWSEDKNIKWKVRIPGEGNSTPVIWENKIFVLSAIPTGKKVEPKPEDAATNEPNPRPELGGAGGPGGRGGGRGGRGGFGGGPKPTEVQQFVVLCL